MNGRSGKIIGSLSANEWGREPLEADCFEQPHTSLFQPGLHVLMPVGDGCYPDRLSDLKRDQWFSMLKGAIDSGAIVDLIITTPNPRAASIWGPWEASSGGRFRIVNVDRARLSHDLRYEVERLDTFHPVLFFIVDQKTRSRRPMGMWIEAANARGEENAYDVEILGPRAAEADRRFEIYYELLTRLIRAFEGMKGR